MSNEWWADFKLTTNLGTNYLLNSKQKDERSLATKADSSNEAGIKIIYKI